MRSIRSFFLCLITGSILFLMNLDRYEAREFWVGGKENSWRIHAPPNELNEWAERERFRIGDSLVFKYDSKLDSVLEVNEDDYKICNKNKPIKEYHDGNTKIELNKSGAFFFISGSNGHCDKGEKLEVKVLSPKHSSIGESSPSASPRSASPIILSAPPVFAPADAPTTNAAGLNVKFIGISTMVMATLVAIAVV